MKFLTVRFSLMMNSFLKFLKKNSIKSKDEMQLPNTPFTGNRQKHHYLRHEGLFWLHISLFYGCFSLLDPFKDAGCHISCVSVLLPSGSVQNQYCHYYSLHSTIANVLRVLLLCANSCPSVSCMIFPWQRADQTEAYPSVILTAKTHAPDNSKCCHNSCWVKNHIFGLITSNFLTKRESFRDQD